MNNFINLKKRAYKFTWLFCVFSFLWFGVAVAQPKLFTAELDNQSGTGGAKNYSIGYPFEGLAFGSYKLVTSSAVGSSSFRFRNNANSQDRQPNTNGTIIPPNSDYSANISDGTSNAFNMVTATNRRYVFKVDAGVTRIAIFEIQSTSIASVSSVTRNPNNVFPGQDVTVTANLDMSLPTGQGVYLRYSTVSNFSTSTVSTMTGSGTTYTASIPSTSNNPSTTIYYYVFTSGNSGVLDNGNNADFFTINANTNGVSNYSYTVNPSWTTSLDGNWNTPATWTANAIPIAGYPVSINHNVTLNQNATVTDITIASGRVLISEAGQPWQLTVAGNFTNNGAANTSFVANDGTVVFSNGTTVGNAITFKNVDINTGSVNLSGDIVTGNLQINGGNISNPPTYGASSTLAYNVNGYTAFNEWTPNATLGAGVPNNVTIMNLRSLSFGNSTQSRQMKGILTISPSATLTLSSASGGDLRIEGNFTNNGTFDAIVSSVGRAVFFLGTSDQTIGGSASSNFPFMIVDKGTSKLILGTNTTISNTLTLTAGDFDLNGKTLTFSGGSISYDGTAAKSILASTASTMNVSATLSITRSAGSNRLSFGSGVTLTTSNGINFGNDFTDMSGVFQINAGGFANTNAPNYLTGSTLRYNSGTTYGRSIEWTNTKTPYNVELTNNTTLDLGANSGTGIIRNVTNVLTIGSGSTFSMNINPVTVTLTVGSLVVNGTFIGSGSTGGDLVCQGNMTINTGGTFTTNGVGNISLNGNFTNNGTFTALTTNKLSLNAGATEQIISGTTLTTFSILVINKTAGKVKLERDINVSVGVDMLAASNTASLNLNGKNINCGSTGNVGENILTSAGYITDESATNESGQGGSIILTGRTVSNSVPTPLAGLFLQTTSGSYTVTVRRRHYRGSGIGVKRIFQVDVTSGNAAGTNTTVVYSYADADLVGMDETTLLQGKWSTGSGWVTYPAGVAPNPLVSILNAGQNTITVLGYNSFSSITGTSSNNNALPVSLLNFNGQMINKTQAKLTWQTATEINNKQFEIEKSLDAVNFSRVGIISGNINSSTIKNYNFTDDTFLTNAYYRLRQVDLNGAESVSQVIFIKNNTDKMLIYPNPTKGEIFIQSNENRQNVVNWRLIDAQGKTVLNGNDTLENTEKVLSNQLQNQQKGMYIIEIQGNKQVYRQKLMVD